MYDLKHLFFDAKLFMCDDISDSVSPSLKTLNDMSFRRIDFGTVASMRESRLSKPHVWAILLCSSEVAELWRRGNVSLGLSASSEMNRDGTLCESFRLFPIGFSGLGNEKEWEIDEREREWELTLAEEISLLRIALFASLRARSMNANVEKEKSGVWRRV